MAVLSAADRVSGARALHQDSIRFASEFWAVSDLVRCLTAFIERISVTEIGTGSGGLELGFALRRTVAEKCMVRWGVDNEARFRELSQALHHLHVTLHAHSVVTSEVRTTATLALRVIEAISAQ